MIAVGLMSGTSLDGVDAALVRLLPRGESYEVDLLDFQTAPFSGEERAALTAILPPNEGSARGVAVAHRALGAAFGRTAAGIVRGNETLYVASHGQTIYHDGNAATTLQIGDPFVIREMTSRTVCFDFRSADCAAGGQGAPLVPYVDALLMASDSEDRVAVNIGGIANITAIPRRARPADVLAFDAGPGNMLIDAFMQRRTGGRQAYDKDGELALRGTPDRAALEAMMRDPFFAQQPPKSTGRERFGAQFLEQHAGHLKNLTIEDGAATLTALTAEALARAIESVSPANARVLVSGGGANNAAIVRALQSRLNGRRVERSDAVKLPADAKEAVAFAVLGYETLRERAANVPRATGARHHAVLGAIAPYALAELMHVVELECRV